MTSYPSMPRNAARYLDAQQPPTSAGPYGAAFFAWLMSTKPRTPKVIRTLLLPFVVAGTILAFAADSFERRVNRIDGRRLDRLGHRSSQIMVTLGGVVLAAAILDAVLSGAMARVIR